MTLQSQILDVMINLKSILKIAFKSNTVSGSCIIHEYMLTGKMERKKSLNNIGGDPRCYSNNTQYSIPPYVHGHINCVGLAM